MTCLLARYTFWVRHLLFNGRADILRVDRVDVAFALGISLCLLGAPLAPPATLVLLAAL